MLLKYHKKYSHSDRKLIKALNKGKEWAFRVIFDRYHNKVFGLARKMGLTIEDSEGIVQELFIILWERKSSINKELSFKAFVFTISKRLVIKRIKKNALRTNYQDDQLSLTPLSNSQGEDQFVYSNLLDHVKEHVDKLPLARKQIFVLSKYDGLSNDEIAARLSISKRTVENQLYRATREMKNSLHSLMGDS